MLRHWQKYSSHSVMLFCTNIFNCFSPVYCTWMPSLLSPQAFSAIRRTRRGEIAVTSSRRISLQAFKCCLPCWITASLCWGSRRWMKSHHRGVRKGIQGDESTQGKSSVQHRRDGVRTISLETNNGRII